MHGYNMLQYVGKWCILYICWFRNIIVTLLVTCGEASFIETMKHTTQKDERENCFREEYGVFVCVNVCLKKIVISNTFKLKRLLQLIIHLLE